MISIGHVKADRSSREEGDQEEGADLEMSQRFVDGGYQWCVEPSSDRESGLTLIESTGAFASRRTGSGRRT